MDALQMLKTAGFFIIFSLSSCTEPSSHFPVETNTQPFVGNETDNIVDPNRPGVRDIEIGISLDQLLRLKYKMTQGSVIAEGDEYKTVAIEFEDGLVFLATFDFSDHLASLDTESVLALDPTGLGPGATLAEVTSAYPKGRFLYGFADDYFVHFVTGTHLMFIFEPSQLDQSCFDVQAACIIDPSLVAKGISIGGPTPK
jgi:hypothetical protein